MDGGEINMNNNIAIPVTAGVEAALPAGEPAWQNLELDNFDGFSGSTGQDVSDERAIEDVRSELQAFSQADESEDTKIPAIEFGISEKDRIEDEGQMEVADEAEFIEKTYDLTSSDEVVKDEEAEKPFTVEDLLSISDKGLLKDEIISRIEAGQISTDAIILALLLMEALKEAKNKEERISLIELFIKFIGRIFLEIAPGGEKVIEKDKSKGLSKRESGLDISSLLTKMKENRQTVIEKKVA